MQFLRDLDIAVVPFVFTLSWFVINLKHARR